MKIYTRTGDDGATSLFGGQRLDKDHARIDAYGTVDETNAAIGLALAHFGSDNSILRDTLERIQRELFVLGADLATPLDSAHSVPRINEDHIGALETDIDAFDAELPALKKFILPGGSPLAAALQVARTVCRRAERKVIYAARTEALNSSGVPYLNRLSDLLFVLSRWANNQAGLDDVEWVP